MPKRTLALESPVLALIIASGLLACGDEAFNEEATEFATEESAIGTGTAGSIDFWIRKNATQKNMPSLDYILCVNVSGDDSAIGRLRAWRDSNVGDNYVARIDVGCREYNDVPNQMVPSRNAGWSVLVRHSNFSNNNGISEVAFSTNRIPRGVRLKLNSGETYVKDIGLYSTTITSNGTVNPDIFEGWTTNYGGNKTKALRCGEDEVLTGLFAGQSTNNGKIRYISITCDELTFP